MLNHHAEVERAKAFAIAAHAAVQQKRKYTLEPYYVHPIEVAAIVMSVTDDLATIQTAFLHDVVEDTGVPIELVRELFGATVGNYVWSVTDQSRPEDGNRKTRKAIDREHLRQGHPNAKTVKLADHLSNGRDIMKNDPKFARVYMREIEANLDVLREGHPVLFARVEKMIENYHLTKHETGLTSE